jgi:hypothetical protein
MRHTGSFVDAGHPLGTVGLFLVLVVARSAGPALATHTTTAGWVSGFAARRVIDAVAIVGWFLDRLPAPKHEAHRERAEFNHRVSAASRTTAVTWM